MQVVAIRDMSAGNETTGEAWQETKIFDGEIPVKEIIRWAASYGPGDGQVWPKLTKRLTITVPHGETI
jgi:hypothetical protein